MTIMMMYSIFIKIIINCDIFTCDISSYSVIVTLTLLKKEVVIQQKTGHIHSKIKNRSTQLHSNLNSMQKNGCRDSSST